MAPEAEGSSSLLTKVATSGPVPPTLTPRVELLDSTTACVIDSYRVAVVCNDRSWSSPARYGREGGGPYEYLDLSGLIAGPDGRPLAAPPPPAYLAPAVRERGRPPAGSAPSPIRRIYMSRQRIR